MASPADRSSRDSSWSGPRLAAEVVSVRAADEEVVAPAAVERVEVAAAVHDVVARAAEEPVDAGSAGDQVVAVTPVEVAGEAPREAPERVGARLALSRRDREQIVAGAALPRAADQDVVALVALHRAGLQVQHVLTVAPRHAAGARRRAVVAVPERDGPDGASPAHGRVRVDLLASRPGLQGRPGVLDPEPHVGGAGLIRRDRQLVRLARPGGEREHVGRAHHVARARPERVDVGRLGVRHDAGGPGPSGAGERQQKHHTGQERAQHRSSNPRFRV
jgi:hypothetical protein